MDLADLLYQAAKSGDTAKVEEIVTNHGVNVRNPGNDLAVLQIAAQNGDLAAVKLFLREGADVKLNFYKSKKDTALYIAAEEGHWKIVQWLLSYGSVVFFNPGEIEEFLHHYSTKMMNNKILQENVSNYKIFIVIPNVCHLFRLSFYSMKANQLKVS